MPEEIQKQKDLYTLHHHLVNSLYKAEKNGKLEPIKAVHKNYIQAQAAVVKLKDKYAFMSININDDNAKKLLVVTDALLLDSIRTTSTTADLTDSESFFSSISSAHTTEGTDSIPSTINSIISSFTKKIDESKKKNKLLNIDEIIAPSLQSSQSLQSLQSLQSSPSSQSSASPLSSLSIHDITFSSRDPFDSHIISGYSLLDATITALNEMVILGGTSEFASPELKTHIISTEIPKDSAKKPLDDNKERHFVITGMLRCINGILIPPTFSDIDHIFLPMNQDYKANIIRSTQGESIAKRYNLTVTDSLDGLRPSKTEFTPLSNELKAEEIEKIRSIILTNFCNNPSQSTTQNKSHLPFKTGSVGKGGTRKIRPSQSIK